MLKNVRKTRRKCFNCFQQAMQNIILLFFLFKLISRAQNCWQKEEEYYCLTLFEINLAIKHYAAPLTLVVIALMVPTDVRHTYICIYSIPIRKLAHICTAKPTSSCHLLSFRTFVKCRVTHSQAASHTVTRTSTHTLAHSRMQTPIGELTLWQLSLGNCKFGYPFLWLPFGIVSVFGFNII